MSDKHLTVKEWLKFSSGRGYKDAALIKALGAAEKGADAAAAGQLQLLDAVEAAGRSLLKQHRGDDKLESYLEDIYTQLKKHRKGAQAAAKAGDAEDSEDDEGEKGVALLDPRRLLAQLTLCRKNPERRVQFAYVDGKDKGPASVAMSPKQAGRKIYAILCEETGVRTGTFGTAWVDGTELMLQLDKAMGGLAKKMRAPIKACGFRASKIVLWNADGTIFEQDATADDAADAAPEAAAPATAAAPVPAAATQMADFTARLKLLLAGVAAAAATLEGKAAKLLATDAGALARQGDFAAANLNLDKVDKLLARRAAMPAAATVKAESPAASTASAASAAAAAGAARSAAWKAARDRWQEANDAVNDQLNKLRVAILAAVAREPEYADALNEIADKGLNAMTGNQRVKLMTSIQAVDDGSPDRLQAHGAKTLELVTAFSSFLASSDQIDACDTNPWDVDVAIRDTLEPALQELAGALQLAA